MSDSVFVDTNILVYAHDRSAGKKYDAASSQIIEFWQNQSAVISTQILQELYVTLTRKVSPALPVPVVRDTIDTYRLWTVVINDADSILGAIDIQQQYQLSFWDSLVIEAARRADCSVLFSEDLNAGQRYAGVEVINPLA